jgi:hypothetical protein
MNQFILMRLQTKVTMLIQNPAGNTFVPKRHTQLTKHYVHQHERVPSFTSVSQPAEHGPKNKYVH